MTTGRIILATGGTGGHIFPAEALAECLRGKEYTAIFLADGRFRRYASSSSLLDYETHILPTLQPGGSLGKKIKGLGSVMLAFTKARAHMKRLTPQAVVGFGGYPSLPTMLAAQSLGLPTVIHEQNALLGKTNRMIAPRARAIATSFTATAGAKPADMAKLRLVGNPVRAAISQMRHTPYQPPVANGPLHLLVTGGSQGAAILGDIIPKALSLLEEAERARIRLVQQVRLEQLEELENACADLNITAVIQPFFNDMPERLGWAHLLIARAGASTVAELACAGRPAILVPLPHAAEDHQTVNARAVADAGAGWLMPQPSFTAEALAARLKDVLSQPEQLAKAAAASHAMGAADAADKLAACVLECIAS